MNLPRKGAEERDQPGEEIRDLPGATALGAPVTQQEEWFWMEGGRSHRGHRRFGSEGYTGAGVVTPPRRDADRDGGTRLPQKGTRVAAQIFTEARDRDVGPDRRNVPWSPENVLIDTVARLQRDLADMRAESRFLRTPGVPTVVPTPRHVAFTSTKVPKFAGTPSWEQYRQVFDVIVLSNGWDDATALQILSRLEGDALNVALLVPVHRRTSRVGLVNALSAHYGSPGRLADYRQQLEKMTRTAGEDPSIFAIALETLAVKAFGDMGQTARLRLIRDRFITGHSSCELHRHLDSVRCCGPMSGVGESCGSGDSEGQ